MISPARLSFAFSTIAAIATLLAAAACGPGRKEPTLAPLPSASVGVPAGAGSASSPAALSVTALPSGLPPFASVPPPGARGSKKAARRDVPGLDTCLPFKATTRDVVAEVERTAHACAKAAALKPVGPVLRGTQGDGEPAARHKVHVDAGRCYRVVLAHDAKAAVIALRDSAGDTVAESPTAAAPEAGVACFTSADDAEITVSIGSGKGSYAAQLLVE
jgi:hypothetical protein